MQLNATVIIATATDNSSENDILRRGADTVRNNCQKVAREEEGGNQRCGVIVLAPTETRPREGIININFSCSPYQNYIRLLRHELYKQTTSLLYNFFFRLINLSTGNVITTMSHHNAKKLICRSMQFRYAINNYVRFVI